MISTSLFAMALMTELWKTDSKPWLHTNCAAKGADRQMLGVRASINKACAREPTTDTIRSKSGLRKSGLSAGLCGIRLIKSKYTDWSDDER